MESSGTTVSARVVRRRTTHAAPSGDALLPARTRFRAFRPATESPTFDDGAAEPVSAAPAPAEEPPSDLPLTREPTRPRVSGAQVAALRARARNAAASPHVPAAEPEAASEAAGDTPQRAADPVSTDRELLVVVSRVRSFAALNKFQSALRALPGVRDTRVRRLYNGTLDLAVDYADGVPLADRLRAPPGRAWTIVSAAPDRIEITLPRAGAPARASGR